MDDLGFPTTLNDLFDCVHFLAAWTMAPRPQESMKSILVKSITTDSWLEAKTSLIYVVNCFSEYASSWPVKLITKQPFCWLKPPLRETVSRCNSVMGLVPYDFMMEV